MYVGEWEKLKCIWNTYFPFSSAGHILLRLAFYLDYNITVERFVTVLDDQLFGPCESYFVVTSK